MNWSKFGNIATALAVLVAVLTLAWQIKEAMRVSRDNSLFLKKQAIVFSIISDGSPTGLDFDTIKTKYLQNVQQKYIRKEIGSKGLQDFTLTNLLFNLKSMSMVYKSHDGKYKENVILDIAVEQQNRYLSALKVEGAFYKRVAKNSCRFSIDELIKYLSIKTEIDITIVSTFINDALNRGSITINTEEKVCLRQDYNPQREIEKMKQTVEENKQLVLKLYNKLASDVGKKLIRMDKAYKVYIKSEIQNKIDQMQ